jgi:hypothetical protein
MIPICVPTTSGQVIQAEDRLSKYRASSPQILRPRSRSSMSARLARDSGSTACRIVLRPGLHATDQADGHARPRIGRLPRWPLPIQWSLPEAEPVGAIGSRPI